jgi:hypothetical protein
MQHLLKKKKKLKMTKKNINKRYPIYKILYMIYTNKFAIINWNKIRILKIKINML